MGRLWVEAVVVEQEVGMSTRDRRRRISRAPSKPRASVIVSSLSSIEDIITLDISHVHVLDLWSHLTTPVFYFCLFVIGRPWRSEGICRGG